MVEQFGTEFVFLKAQEPPTHTSVRAYCTGAVKRGMCGDGAQEMSLVARGITWSSPRLPGGEGGNSFCPKGVHSLR